MMDGADFMDGMDIEKTHLVGDVPSVHNVHPVHYLGESSWLKWPNLGSNEEPEDELQDAGDGEFSKYRNEPLLQRDDLPREAAKDASEGGNGVHAVAQEILARFRNSRADLVWPVAVVAKAHWNAEVARGRPKEPRRGKGGAEALSQGRGVDVQDAVVFADHFE